MNQQVYTVFEYLSGPRGKWWFSDEGFETNPQEVSLRNALEDSEPLRSFLEDNPGVRARGVIVEGEVLIEGLWDQEYGEESGVGLIQLLPLFGLKHPPVLYCGPDRERAESFGGDLRVSLVHGEEKGE